VLGVKPKRAAGGVGAIQPPSGQSDGSEKYVVVWDDGTYTLHPTLNTQHPTPYAMHPTPDAIHPTLYTLRTNQGPDP